MYPRSSKATSPSSTISRRKIVVDSLSLLMLTKFYDFSQVFVVPQNNRL